MRSGTENSTWMREGGETEKYVYKHYISTSKNILCNRSPLREESKKRYSEYLLVSFNSFTFFSVKLIHIQLLAFMEFTRQRKLSSYLLVPFIFSFAAKKAAISFTIERKYIVRRFFLDISSLGTVKKLHRKCITKYS